LFWFRRRQTNSFHTFVIICSKILVSNFAQTKNLYVIYNYIDLDSKAFRPRGWSIKTAILLRSSLESENWETVLSEALFGEAIIYRQQKTTARQQATWSVGIPGTRARPLPWKRYDRITMSRQLCDEAVLCNILHYFNSTKHKRNGVSIASRDFLLSIAFHKRSFQTMGLSSREISDTVSVNRNTLLPHLGNATPLENIILQPYKKESASNDWRKREVLLQLVDHFFIVIQMVSGRFVHVYKFLYEGWRTDGSGSRLSLDGEPHSQPKQKGHCNSSCQRERVAFVCSQARRLTEVHLCRKLGCKRHQRYFQSSSTKALFKTFIQQYPLRRGMQH